MNINFYSEASLLFKKFRQFTYFQIVILIIFSFSCTNTYSKTLLVFKLSAEWTMADQIN